MVEGFTESRYFEPDRRGGSTAVYFRIGSEFKEVSIPYGDSTGDFPACEDKSFEKKATTPMSKILSSLLAR
jgi:hypothetical protein